MASLSSSKLITLSLMSFIFLEFLVHEAVAAGRGASTDPTDGFIDLPFNTSYYRVQYPYNLKQDNRYSFVDGVHKLWVYRNDKPHSPNSDTSPRTEIDIQGYRYSSGVWQFEGHGYVPQGTSGVWQFEGHGYVPQGTSGVCIMQVFGDTQHATTLMLHVYNGVLKYYQDEVVARDIYNRWFRLNVIHDVDADNLKVFIDGQLKLTVKGRGETTHYFKCGVYGQDYASQYMESRWKNIKVLKLRD